MILVKLVNISVTVSSSFILKDLYLPKSMFVLVSLILSIPSNVIWSMSQFFLSCFTKKNDYIRQEIKHSEYTDLVSKDSHFASS